SLLSAVSATLFRDVRSIVRPPLMLLAPANGAWPAPLTANLHCTVRSMRRATETSSAEVGVKRQTGESSDDCSDQRLVCCASYTLLPGKLTFPQRIAARKVHFSSC